MLFAEGLLALLLAYLAACSFYPALSLSTRPRLAILVLIVSAIAATPLLLPYRAGVGRVLLSILNMVLMLKLWDLHVDASKAVLPSWPHYRTYLHNISLLVRRRSYLERQPGQRQNLQSLCLNFGLAALASAALAMLFRVDWSDHPFMIEHAVKASVFFFLGLRSMDVIAALLRAAGLYTITPCHNPFASRTPADFWRRYNRWMGLWLYENVFTLAGGRRNPVRGTFAAFVVSGLIHEYIFLLAVGRPQGYQMLYFLLQGMAVAATLRIRPTGAAAIAWGIATFAFNIGTSVIFFASIQGGAQIYQRGLPGWLQGW